MYKKQYKDSDIKLSMLGMGTMRLPILEDRNLAADWRLENTTIDQRQADAMVDRAFELGINYFDTAYFYHDGKAEGFLGQALKRHKRSSYYIATKMPLFNIHTREDVDRVFREQCERLQVDYFDFYLAHNLNSKSYITFKELDIYEYMRKKKDSGQAGQLGFSFHHTPKTLEDIVANYEWDFAQLQINYVDWEGQDAKGQYEVLERNGLPCVVMEPVRGGMLADLGPGNALLKAKRPDMSIASWAIRYAASLPNVMTVLSGMSTVEQLEDNAATMRNFEPLSDDEREVLSQARELLRESMGVPCTSCNYCNECPSNINIPEYFKIYNKTYAIGKDSLSFRREAKGIKAGKASDCIDCGLCAEVCPQRIEIPKLMKEMAQI